MKKQNKKFEISILEMDIFCYITLIASIFAIIIAIPEISQFEPLFSVIIITISIIIMIFSGCIVAANIVSKIEYKKLHNVKKIPKEFYKRTITSENELFKMIIFLIITTPLLLIIIDIALICM